MQKRIDLIKKVQRIPDDKLKELELFLSELESKTNRRDAILSLAGSWEQIDEDIFSIFTTGLIQRRANVANWAK